MSPADKQRHPLSAAFGDIAPDEYAELVADITAHGLIAAIVTAADGTILDGWHRYRACLEAGVKPRFEPFAYVIEPAAEVAGRTMTEAEFVVAQNVHRRHLTREQRRAIVVELLKAKPEASDRAIAAQAKVSPTTVGDVRRDLEATVQIGQSAKRICKDGRKRAQPTSAPAPVPTKPPPMTPAHRAALDAQWAFEEEAQLAAERERQAYAESPAPQGAWAAVLGSIGAIAQLAIDEREAFDKRLQPMPRPRADMAQKLADRLVRVLGAICDLTSYINDRYLTETISDIGVQRECEAKAAEGPA